MEIFYTKKNYRKSGLKGDQMKLLLIGGTGFLGQNISRYLFSAKVEHIVLGSDILGSGDAQSLYEVILNFRPTGIIFLAAKVGSMESIKMNPLEFLLANIKIFSDTFSVFQRCAQNNICFDIINIISNCVYPAKVDVQYENLMEEGCPHPSVEAFAQAKRTLVSLGKSMRENYGTNVLNLVLANSFGPFDHLDISRSHALTGMVVRMIEAKKKGAPAFEVWGTGQPIRSWLYAPDFAAQVPRLFEEKKFWVHPTLNFPASLPKISIKELAVEIADAVDFDGEITFDLTKGDGDPVKVLNADKFQNIYTPKMTAFPKALQKTITYFSIP